MEVVTLAIQTYIICLSLNAVQCTCNHTLEKFQSAIGLLLERLMYANVAQTSQNKRCCYAAETSHSMPSEKVQSAGVDLEEIRMHAT